jgi:MFS family permease
VRRGALRHPAFRLLFLGQAVSSLGDRLVPVALAFAVLDLTGSVTDLGIVAAAQTVPLVVFVLLGGVWADRLPRQRVMLGSDAVRAVAQGVSALLLLEGQAHVWQLAVLQAVYGAAEAFFGPASTAVVPQTVESGDLQRANALMSLSGNVAGVLGPAFAGVIVATIGAGWGLAIDGATFVVSAVFLAMMRVEPVLLAVRASTLAELRAGWHAFRSRTWLWVTVAYFTLFIGFVYAPLLVLGPQVARTSLGGAGAWAAIATALGLGSLVGGLIGFRWRPRYPLRVAFLAFLIAGPALFGLLAAHAPLPLIVAAALVDGASGPLFNTLWYTALQREVPPAELSRVSSWDYLGSLAMLPVGQAISGPVGEAIGISRTLYLAGALFVVLLLAVLAVPAVRNFSSEAAASAA